MPPPDEIRVGNRNLRLSNLDKVFYPKVGFTKAQVIDYYARVSKALLPHLKNRPLTLKRYPQGADGDFFYEKRCPEHRPNWVQTAPIPSQRAGGNIDFCLANDLATLVWAANLASLELHTSLSLARDIARPTVMAFDLDPGAPADIVDCCKVALMLKALLERLKLQAFAKTSGSKGLQVYVPVNTPTTYDDTKMLSKAIAQLFESEHPQLVVSLMKKNLRPGKVFIDWSQNDEAKTTVCVYSLRAKDRPTVSTPVDWDEVKAMAAGRSKALSFEADEVLARVERRGDLFAPVLKLKQKLPVLSPTHARASRS